LREQAQTRQCKKHKTYKGLKPIKRDCPDCQRLYRSVQRAIHRELNPDKPYQSITTKDKRFGVIEFVAELSCLMLYGLQPPYFWNTNSRAARHFKRELAKMFAWRRRDKTPFEAVNTVFYHTYAQHFKEILAERARNKPERYRKVKQDDCEDEKAGKPVGVEYFGYDHEQVERQRLGKRYRKREKEEAKKEGRQKD